MYGSNLDIKKQSICWHAAVYMSPYWYKCYTTHFLNLKCFKVCWCFTYPLRTSMESVTKWHLFRDPISKTFLLWDSLLILYEPLPHFKHLNIGSKSWIHLLPKLCWIHSEEVWTELNPASNQFYPNPSLINFVLITVALFYQVWFRASSGVYL